MPYACMHAAERLRLINEPLFSSKKLKFGATVAPSFLFGN